MTAIFVLFMVAAQARDIGLSPADIAHLVPYVIPSTLPYTIPVSLLFAATVVYGRLAGDNEIIAVKSAGLSVWTVIVADDFSGTGASAGFFTRAPGWIPRSSHNAKMVLFKDLEDMFYKLLARDREFNHPKWPFLIKVRDVQGSKMIDPTFKHKVKGSSEYDAIIQARAAELHFHMKRESGACVSRRCGDSAAGAGRGRVPDQQQRAAVFDSAGQQIQHGNQDPGTNQRGDRQPSWQE